MMKKAINLLFISILLGILQFHMMSSYAMLVAHDQAIVTFVIPDLRWTQYVQPLSSGLYPIVGQNKALSSSSVLYNRALGSHSAQSSAAKGPFPAMWEGLQSIESNPQNSLKNKSSRYPTESWYMSTYWL